MKIAGFVCLVFAILNFIFFIIGLINGEGRAAAGLLIRVVMLGAIGLFLMSCGDRK